MGTFIMVDSFLICFACKHAHCYPTLNYHKDIKFHIQQCSLEYMYTQTRESDHVVVNRGIHCLTCMYLHKYKQVDPTTSFTTYSICPLHIQTTAETIQTRHQVWPFDKSLRENFAVLNFNLIFLVRHTLKWKLN